MTENDNVQVITVAVWQDEIGSILQAQKYIGEARIYLTQKCYESLRKIIPNDASNNTEGTDSNSKRMKVTICNKSKYNQQMYHLEMLIGLGVSFSYQQSKDDRIFILKKPEETLECRN